MRDFFIYDKRNSKLWSFHSNLWKLAQTGREQKIWEHVLGRQNVFAARKVLALSFFFKKSVGPVMFFLKKSLCPFNFFRKKSACPPPPPHVALPSIYSNNFGPSLRNYNPGRCYRPFSSLKPGLRYEGTGQRKMWVLNSYEVFCNAGRGDGIRNQPLLYRR